MDRKKNVVLKEAFDDVVQAVEKEHVEFWYARDIHGIVRGFKIGK